MASSRLRQAWSRGTLWVSALVVAGVVLAGIIIVATSNHHSTKTDDAATTSGSPSPSSSPSPTAAASDTAPALPSGYVTLPKPTGRTNGFPTGYPHTPEGAAAFAAAYDKSITTLDYPTATSAYKAYAKGGKLEYASMAVANLRQTDSVDLPLNGAAPAGAAVATTIEGIKWSAKGADVNVSIEDRLTFTLPGNHTVPATATSPIPVVWSNGRWWIDMDAPDGADVEYAEPGTAAYSQAGWRVIENDDWMGE